MFGIMKQGSPEEHVNFEDFVNSLRFLCRSSDMELDSYIFQMFDLSLSASISLSEMIMMIMNMPDIGFSNP